jgi:putative ABC transport system permease protein
MQQLLMDLRFAVRMLWHKPGTSIAIVVTLALAIGANASVFGVVDALVLHPFSMPEVDRIVMPVTTSPRWVALAGRRETVSPADFLDWRRAMQGGAIERMAAIEWWDANLVGRDEPERVPGFFVSPEFFAALEASPALGRTFLTEEQLPANAKRVILSDALWKRRFGADSSLVGRPVLIDGAQWTVVGVMPPAFDFPLRSQLWAPLAFDEKSSRNRAGHYLTVIGRLGAGRTLDDARVQMRTVAQRLAREHPDTNGELGLEVYTLSRGMTDPGVPRVLGLWQAAGVFVLLIACANIANLLLARAAEREREIGIRLALGSSRGRIVRGAFVETALLVAAAIPLALGVAWASLRVMHALMPARIVRFVAGWDRMGVDRWTIAVTIGYAIVAALAFGVLPAAQLARRAVTDALKSDGRTGAGPGRQRVRRTLVIAEIGLVLPLLVAGMLSVSAVVRFLTSWQGYDPDNVLTLRVALPESAYADSETRARFAFATLDQLETIGGVRDVAAANVLPAIDSNARRSIEIAGQPQGDPTKAPRVDFRAISSRYFDVLRLPIVTGRAFGDGDQGRSEPVAIVSESMARRFWPAGSALGERVRILDGRWMRIVGICGDVVHDWFDGRAPTLYVPLSQAPTGSLAFALRTSADPNTIVADVRRAIARVDPTQPAYDVMPMRQALSERTISLQYIAGVMGAFAGLALLLALLGLYAVMTFLVAHRVREIGVRIALGATTADVIRMTLSQAARLTAAGIAIGLVLAVALARAMEAGLLGVVSSDARMTTLLAVALAATALVASYLPARRAAAIDPVVALRTE